MAVYPTRDAELQIGRAANDAPRAPIAAVRQDSPAYDAGFEPGCCLTSVDGEPLRDIIDWRWLAAGDAITIGYIDLDGDQGEVELWREEGEDWGFEFEGAVFDGIKQCRNACCFCFMRQLPEESRPSLTLRDDDFRLSFLSGTFVTFTNLSAEDEQRILEQRISPLRMSLHAHDSRVRRQMIGKHEAHGIQTLERLARAGIRFHTQIVLVPGMNDGEVLEDTLAWAYGLPGIENVGIVPLGYTKHQTQFTASFNEVEAARAVIETILPFQERALAERGTPWVFAADEFYTNAYPDDLFEHLPSTSHYGDFSMFEDGIGIVRSTVDAWEAAERAGIMDACARACDKAGIEVRLIAGCAQREFLTPLIERSPLCGHLSALYVVNDYFGGNVDVTGLLVGCDIARAIAQDAATRPEGFPRPLYAITSIIFNDNGMTLDDKDLSDIENAAGQRIAVLSCSPSDYVKELTALVAEW